MISLARIISFLTNPIFVLFPIPYLLIYRFGYGHILAFKWTLFSFIFLFIAGVFVIYEVKNKTFSDMDVSKREQRPLLFAVTTGITVIYLVSLYILKAPAILFISVWGIMVGILLATIINTRIKASLHVCSITAVTLTLVRLYYLSPILLLIVPIVAWSRIKIKRHSVPEVITGFILGVILPAFMYVLLKYTMIITL